MELSSFYLSPFIGSETRRNLILNPPIVPAFPPGTGTNVTTSTLGGRTLITHTVAAAPGDAYFTMPTTPLLAGTTYAVYVAVEKVSGTVPAPVVSVYDGFSLLQVLTVTDEDPLWIAQGTVTLVGAPVNPRIIVDLQGTGTGESVRAWANVEQGATIPPYLFDGAFTDTETARYSWAGTAYNSASILTSPTAAETLTPEIVFGPFESERETRNIARELLHSRDVRVTYVPNANRTGEFQCLFETHAEAKAAASWFSEDSLYYFGGPEVTTDEGWEIVDDIIIETAQTTVADESFAMTFLIWGGGLRVTQNEPMWELRVPYKEIVDGEI